MNRHVTGGSGHATLALVVLGAGLFLALRLWRERAGQGRQS